MRYKELNALALLSIWMLTACVTTPTTGIPCAALDPISYSASQDSAFTVQQVREFNAVLAELCP